MTRWCQALLGLIALALAPTLFAANPCTTGGTRMIDGTGQGGTGLQPADPDGSGQGDTGLSPVSPSGGDGSGSGSGLTVEVDGMITGFASICVNGVELHYSPTTLVTLHGKPAMTTDLAVGQVVRALAKGQGDQLSVQRVQVRHLLVATLQGIDPGGVRAQGRTISLSRAAMRSSGVAAGDKVAISGFVGANGRTIATRVDVVPKNTPDSLTGEVKRNAQGEWNVDGVVLEGPLPRLEPGDSVRAEGRFAQGRMQVTRIEREERTRPVDRIVIQGPVRHADKSGLSIGNQRFLIDADTRIKQALPRTGEWTKIDAVREGHQFRARELEVQTRPDLIQDRRPTRKEGGVERGNGAKASSSEQERHTNRDVDRLEQAKEQSKHSDRLESPEKTKRTHLSERPERTEPTRAIKQRERVERAEAIERPERIEHPEHPERPQRVERPETIERPERVERPERIERLEPIERPERVERPELPEQHD